MASKNTLSLFTLVTLLVLLSLISHVTSSETHNQKTPPFEFLNHLKGCQKGDKVQGIQDLKRYPEKFGYLNGYSDNDDFDDILESAIKTYQVNYHLKATGKLDAKTLSRMMMPRCGFPDIINGTTSMRSGKKGQPHHHGGHGSTHTVAHFSFFSGNPKWPSSKYHLTYAFDPSTPAEAQAAVARAFATWANNTHFSFSQFRNFSSEFFIVTGIRMVNHMVCNCNTDNSLQSYDNADLKISFARGDHGDGSPFDGRGGTLAHSFPPTNGRFHYDADEQWAVGAVEGAYDLETVALHEIGHLLGLGHSSVEGAVMSSTVRTGFTQGLHADDIQGIKALYNT